MIKLLRGQSEHVDEKLKIGKTEVSIKFDINVITSQVQARLMDLVKLAFTDEGKQRYYAAQFINCIDEDVIVIQGEEISASELAKRADLSHEDTMRIIGFVSGKIDKFTFAQDEEVKK